jgi:hypothetical protein
MKYVRLTIGMSSLALVFGFAFDPVAAQGPPTASPPVYRPPVRGAPGGRVGGGTRGTGQSFVLAVMAPDHTGLTAQDQPALYWYVTKPISTPMVFTLADEGVKPVVETTLTPPFHPGAQKVRLADLGVRLMPGKAYRWYVALVVDPERRSKDILAGGTIERVELSDGLAARLSRANKSEAVRLYAEAGLWYDAVSAASDLIEAAPKDAGLRAPRASLLQQVGLTEIGESDLNAKHGE